LVGVTGVLALTLWAAGFWYLRVTPVTVINLSRSTFQGVEIDLQGKKLDIGTLEYLDARKVYAIPGRGSMMAISLVSQGRAVHREVEYMEGGEGEPQIVLILSAENVMTVSAPGHWLK